jgi:hypothetical protein
MHAITRNTGINLDAANSGIELVKLNPARGELLNIKKLILWQNAKRLDLDFTLMRPEENYGGKARVAFHSDKISIQENS